MMFTRHALIAAAALYCAIPLSSAIAQAPIAGSGALPAINPLAQSPRDVVDAVKKFMSIRKDRGRMHKIKACFRESRVQPALRQICRQRLDRYFAQMLRKFPEIFSRSQPLELYIKFVEISEDPDSLSIRRDLFALRGIITEVIQARGFRRVKECFKDAGPQPAIQQICRQKLEAFHTELLRTRGIELRDVSLAVIRRRLLAVATADQVSVMGGDMTAFESLRKIRKAQQEKKAAAKNALNRAWPYYCRAKSSRRATLRSRLLAPGVCICTYGRRYAASGARSRSRPVRVVAKSCSPGSRFRVGDLNGGRLRHGDWVTLRAAHDGYLSMNRGGLVYANRERAGKAEKFRLIKATNLPGLIRRGELIVLVSARGVFVVPDLKQGRLKATKQKPAAHEYFTLMPD